VVFVVDRSASILFPIDTTNTACRLADNTVCGTQGVDNCDQTRCPTRLRTVQLQLETFLSIEGRTGALLGVAGGSRAGSEGR
jgi:hypothetical protein